MKWFQEITSLDELRKTYKKLVIKYHPDNGGSEETIKEINAEYDILFKRIKSDYEKSDRYQHASGKQKQPYDWQKDMLIRNTIMQLSRFKGITVEIIGVWIWVSDCYAYRKELKQLGFHWARQKQMWYLHFDDYHKFSSRPVPMSHIRAKYGSVVVNTSQEEKDHKDIRKEYLHDRFKK